MLGYTQTKEVDMTMMCEKCSMSLIREHEGKRSDLSLSNRNMTAKTDNKETYKMVRCHRFKSWVIEPHTITECDGFNEVKNGE